MSYSITGIAYLVLLFSLGYLFYRFFYYWKKEKDPASKQALYIVGLFGLFVLMTAIGGLFFADNSFVLEKIVGIGAFIQAFAFGAMAYNIIYLKFSRISPWLGSIPIFILGLTAAILTVTRLQFTPLLEESGAINWGFPSGSTAVLVSLLRFFLSSATFIPLIIIFFSQFKNSEDSHIKEKSLGLGLAFLLILIGASFDFLFIGFFNLSAIARDVAFIVCSIILFITLIFTLPHSPSKI